MIYVSFVRVPYAALAKAFSLIEATTKRLEKTSLLTSLFLLVIRRRAKDDIKSLLQTVYLWINSVFGHFISQCISWPFAQLSPDYIGIELGIGESLLIKAIGESTGRGLATIKADLKKEGDLGLVAMVCWLPDFFYVNAYFTLYLPNRIPRTARRHSSSRNHWPFLMSSRTLKISLWVLVILFVIQIDNVHHTGH